MVEESINLQVLHWPTPQGKVPQAKVTTIPGAGCYGLGVLGYFCCPKETKGLLEKIEDVSGSFFKM